MDELMDKMADTIAGMFDNYFWDLKDVMTLAKAAPDSNVLNFPATELWNTSQNISTSISTAVASVLISLFLFFELSEIFNRSDTKGWDGVYWILMALMKVAVGILIAKNMSIIIKACFGIGSAAVNVIGDSVFSTSALKDVNKNLTKAVKDYYSKEDLGFWKLLVGFMQVFLINLVNKVSMALVKVVCQLRFIEIYVFTAVAPIPFCTFVSKEYKSIGINYLKRLTALGLQGLFIAVVCQLYGTILTSAFQDGEVSLSSQWTVLGYTLLLLIAIFQTGGWAKSLLQVS